nr:unnamed protein product [Callosobruchus chinensis]
MHHTRTLTSSATIQQTHIIEHYANGVLDTPPNYRQQSFVFANTIPFPKIKNALQHDTKRLQKVKSSSSRLIIAIRRGYSISERLIETNWLNMRDRRKLHSACFYHKVVIYKTPSNLYNKITFRQNVHTR